MPDLPSFVPGLIPTKIILSRSEHVHEDVKPRVAEPQGPSWISSEKYNNKSDDKKVTHI